jgi:hypothetical protein
MSQKFVMSDQTASVAGTGRVSDLGHALLRECYSLEPPEPFCSRPPSISFQYEGRSEGCFCPEKVTVVGPANLERNLLLADLRKLSAIVENEEEENTA